MSLRWRFALLLAGSVAVTALAVGCIAYASAARELWARTDASLVSQANRAIMDFGETERAQRPLEALPPPFLGASSTLQLLDPQGQAHQPFATARALPLSELDLAIATKGAPAGFADVTVDGVTYRVYTMPLPKGGAVQVGIDTAPLDEVLVSMRRNLLALGALATALAAGVGVLVARRTVRPIEDLTVATERVAATRDLAATTRVDVSGSDEVARLARSFNEMVDALAESRAQQQRLVQDAGHELRTPLTSVRTNLEVLSQPGALDRLDPAERDALMADLVSELTEMTDLVNDLVDAARATTTEEPVVELSLDEIASHVATRARSRGAVVELHV